VRLPERDSLPHQPFGDIGGQGEAFWGGCSHAINIEGQRPDHPGHRRQHEEQLIDRVEGRLFVFLQISVIAEGQGLERGQEPCQVADQSPGFAACEFGDVRVLLLRHDRRAGGPLVVQRDPREFATGHHNDFLADAR